jgi:hypothetical protein
MSMMTNFRAEDMPGSNGPKPDTKKAPAKVAPKKVEKPVEVVAEVEETESE